MVQLGTLGGRLLIACVFGLAVAGVTIYLIPGQVDHVYNHSQYITRRRIESVAQALSQFRKEEGAFPQPASQQALDLLQMHDGWDSPLRYSLPDGQPLIESLGRDGIRGGVGLNADISNLVPRPPEAAIPLWQKLTHPEAQTMIFVALLCGCASASLVFLGLKDETTNPQSWTALGVLLLLTFGMATLGATFITAVHVPSGH